MGPEVTSDPGQVASGSSQSSACLQCAYKYSVITFCRCCDLKKKLGIVPVSVLEKQSIRNSTLVFDDCFLPPAYLRFERTIGNVVPESMLFFLSLKETVEGEVVGEWKNGKRSKGVLGLFLPFQTIYHFLFGFNRES